MIYMSTVFVGVICLQTTIPAGYQERLVFYREQVRKQRLISLLAMNAGLVSLRAAGVRAA